MKWVIWLAIAFAVGCSAAHPASMAPGDALDRTNEDIEGLRRDQLKLLYDFEMAMSDSADRCADLCEHHSKICALATRICGIADRHPDHPRAGAACQQANETCATVTQRLPQECWCNR